MATLPVLPVLAGTPYPSPNLAPARRRTGATSSAAFLRLRCPHGPRDVAAAAVENEETPRNRRWAGKKRKRRVQRRWRVEETAPHQDKRVGRSLKRQRGAADDEDERRKVKKQVVDREENLEEEKEGVLAEEKEEEKVQVVTPETQTPKISAKKEKNHKKKTDEKVTRKRIPLQDITHLYVNERTRSYEQQQRDRFVAGLSMSVAIRGRDIKTAVGRNQLADADLNRTLWVTKLQLSRNSYVECQRVE